MNERMIELALQAEDYAFDEISNLESSVEPVISNRVFFKSFKEKFAELMVQECMTMCDTVSADYLKHRKGAFDFQDKNIYAEGEAACDIIKYKMKKHFGVEE